LAEGDTWATAPFFLAYFAFFVGFVDLAPVATLAHLFVVFGTNNCMVVGDDVSSWHIYLRKE
jgi:hypothetical protein